MSRVESKDYYVFELKSHAQIRCVLRGKFKKDFSLKKDKLFQTDIAVVGDRVKFDFNDDGTGFIYEILPRENYLSRKAPRIRGASYRGERLEQIIAANLDQVFIVTSISEPEFNSRTVDRFLVACESSKLNVNIIINKIDLDENDSHKEWYELYSSIGYNVLLTSTKTELGINNLKSILPNKKNLFWGQSGVGKSSILNKIYPHLNLKVGEISNYTSKGTHTTVTSSMFFVGDNTYLIDTPGVREIDPYGIKKEDLGHYFVEFSEFINECKFNTCTHKHEPGCAVVKAVKQGKISEERYDSYLRMLETVEEDINF
ncbi:MAG: ribosome small subunit-dependent GTPase A [Ignavibacterium album]|nr:ribosome small subunit-dependent GTPase A [Ignavibacterium album]MCX8106834.1 ribosome small subunit-dependent GTPase A [Ignavibacterium album]